MSIMVRSRSLSLCPGCELDNELHITDFGYLKARLWGTPDGIYEHILNAPNQQLAVRKILDLPGVTHVLVMDFDERLMIVLVAGMHIQPIRCARF
jgi:hypothetical protein